MEMLFVQLSVPALNYRLPDRFQPTANAVPTVVFSINFFFQYVKERLILYKYQVRGCNPSLSSQVLSGE